LYAPSRTPSGYFSVVVANSAYTLRELEHLKRFDEINTPDDGSSLLVDDIANHAKLQRHLKTSLCLDESIATSAMLKPL